VRDQLLRLKRLEAEYMTRSFTQEDMNRVCGLFSQIVNSLPGIGSGTSAMAEGEFEEFLQLRDRLQRMKRARS